MMPSLTKDPQSISRFEQGYTSSNVEAHSPFCLFQWHRGERGSQYFGRKCFQYHLSNAKLQENIQLAKIYYLWMSLEIVVGGI
jgi:hypothetical protein